MPKQGPVNGSPPCDRGTSPILSPRTLQLHYSASYLIALLCPGGVAGPPRTRTIIDSASLLCGWSDGLEWSPGCAASECSFSL